MRRYLSLFLHFAKNCWIAELEFRANLVVWSVVNIFWGAFSFVFIGLIFTQVQDVAGWTRDQALILGGVHSMFVGFLWTFVFPNLDRFSGLITNGEFDFYLTKPINTRFLTSFRVIEFDNIPRLFFALSITIYLLSSRNFPISISAVLSSILLFLLSVFIFYNLYFMITTLCVWLVKVFNLMNLFDSITDMGRYPVQIFTGISRFAFVYIVPVGFIATFTTLALLGKNSLQSIITALFLSVVIFTLSQKFWHFALRHYSSASS